MSIPAAYIRRSFVDAESPGDVSEAAQLAAVRKLAHTDGHNGDLVVYSDWGVSADVAKASKRTEYTRLLADMEAGTIGSVYAFDVDRLYRDPRDLIRLQDAATRHQVTIKTTAGELAIGEGDDPAAEAFAFIGAIFGRMELQKAKKRARAAREARRERDGGLVNQPPYGKMNQRQPDGSLIQVPNPDQPLEPIIAAYKEAGSILGACRILEEKKVPAPRGGSRWATSLVTRILERAAAEGMDVSLPAKSAAGLRTPSRATLAQLLRCPFCGKMLTPNTARGQLYCSNGPRDRDTHPRYAVREVDVLPWVQAEADLFDPGNYIEAEGAESQRAAIIDRRERALELYLAKDPMMSRERYQAEQDRAEAELEALDTRGALREIPTAVDWDSDPAKLNAWLRSIFVAIDLDENLHPVRAEWRVPEYRAH